MTEREKVAESYDIGEDGIIRSPGKFEGEPWYAVTLWNLALEGCADEDNGRLYGFRFIPEDKFIVDDVPVPEGASWALLSESEQGFVTLSFAAEFPEDEAGDEE